MAHADPRRDRIADVYAELRVALLAYLRKHVGDAQAAEDLLHDVVVKALAAGADAAHAPDNLTGWLYAVARNAAMDYHRRRRPVDALTDEMAEGVAAESPDEAQAAIEELANCLRPMAERLPATYRDTVIAAEFGGASLAAVAQVQGLTLAAVKTRASRGRRLLQAELVQCCKVSLSPSGEVVDYDAQAAAQCRPRPGGGKP